MTVRLEEWRLKRRDTEEWMRHRQLPQDLQERVRRFVQYKWLATRGVDEESILHALPPDLRRDIQRNLCLDLVRRVSYLFFRFLSSHVTIWVPIWFIWSYSYEHDTFSIVVWFDFFFFFFLHPILLSSDISFMIHVKSFNYSMQIPPLQTSNYKPQTIKANAYVTILVLWAGCCMSVCGYSRLVGYIYTCITLIRSTLHGWGELMCYICVITSPSK